MERTEKSYYVLAKGLSFRPLSFKQLPNRPGGHIKYVDGNFAKVPNVKTLDDGRSIYTGDTALFTSSSLSQMKKSIKVFNEAWDRFRPIFKGQEQDLRVINNLQEFCY